MRPVAILLGDVALGRHPGLAPLPRAVWLGGTDDRPADPDPDGWAVLRLGWPSAWPHPALSRWRLALANDNQNSAHSDSPGLARSDRDGLAQEDLL